MLAMVGGRDWDASKLNLATIPCEGCGRQAGSAFKPFTLAAALDQGFALRGQYWSGPSSMTITDPQCSGPDGLWTPTNAGDSSAGTVDLYGATENSVNTVYAQLVAALAGGPNDVVEMAHTLGIMSDLPPVCSITLGSVAVNILEMTNAYATLATRRRLPPCQPLWRSTGRNGGPADRKVASRPKPRFDTPDVPRAVTSALEGSSRAARAPQHRSTRGPPPAKRGAPRTTSTPGSADTPCSSRRACGSGIRRNSVP